MATLLGSPRARGLFRHAVAQSGAAHNVLPPTAGETVADRFLAALGVDSVTGLEAAPVEAVLAAQGAAYALLDRGAGLKTELGVPVSPFYPTVGNEVLPEPPLDAIRDGLNAEVPVLAGSNRDESTMWGYGNVDDTRLARIAASFGATEVLPTYRRTRPGASARDLLIAVTTDHMFRIPAIRLAEVRAARTWLYQFNWPSRVPHLGATHALEIPFAFDNLHQPGVDGFVGPGPRPQHLADAMHSAWTRLVREGDPGFAPYSPEKRETMVFDDASAVVEDPDGEEREAWNGLR